MPRLAKSAKTTPRVHSNVGFLYSVRISDCKRTRDDFSSLHFVGVITNPVGPSKLAPEVSIDGNGQLTILVK